jgi:hypothetical protein
MKRAIALVGILVALGACRAHAQNTVDFELDVMDPAGPTLTWSTSPPADGCLASGAWNGQKAASGAEVLGQLGSVTIECSWQGDALIEATWTNPTENTDGTAYDNPGVTRLVWTRDGNLGAFNCMASSSPGGNVFFSDRPFPQSMHTITGLTPGDWTLGAFAVNAQGICSAMSNTATKMLVGNVTVRDTITISVPNPITGLGAT